MKRFDFNKDDKDKEYWYIDDSKTNKTYYIDNLEELCEFLNEYDDLLECMSKYSIASVKELDAKLKEL